MNVVVLVCIGETRSAVQHVDFVEAAEIDDDGGAVMTLRWLTGRLETALRLAKKAHLDCGQVCDTCFYFNQEFYPPLRLKLT